MELIDTKFCVEERRERRKRRDRPMKANMYIFYCDEYAVTG